MRKLHLQTGGRPRSLDDLQVLTTLIEKTTHAPYTGRGAFIVQGCEVVGNNVGAGVVFIGGKLMEFPGASGVTFPIYIRPNDEVFDVPQVYESGESKTTQREITAGYQTTAPGSGEYITVTASGGRTYFNAIADKVVLVEGSQTIAGKTFSGAITIPNGTASGHAVNKGQLDSVQTLANGKVSRIGDTMTGPLTVSGAGIRVTGVSSSGSDVFHADANGQSFGGYRITAGATGHQWAFRGGSDQMSLTDATNSADRLVINTVGNIGMGTTPSGSEVRLLVKSTNPSRIGIGLVRFGGGNIIAGFRENTAGNGEMYLYNSAGSLHSYLSDGGAYFSNNVGIGTTTPNAPLQFAQTTSNRKIVLRESANNDHEFFGFGHDGTGAMRYQIPATTASHAWFAGLNSTTSKELQRLQGNGTLFNYGKIISAPNGTEARNAKMQARSPVLSNSMTLGNGSEAAFAVTAPDGTHGLFFGSSSTGRVWMQGGRQDTNTATYDIVMQGQGGNLGVGYNANQSPPHKLSVLGTGHVRLHVESTSGSAGVQLKGDTHTWSIYAASGSSDLAFWDTAQRFRFTAGGIGYATNWIWTSDLRKKTDIRHVDFDLGFIQNVARLARRYQWKEGKKVETGFIAQELRAIAPEYVYGEETENSYLGIDYSRMVVPLYSGVAALIQEVETLKSKLAAHGIT